jgi:hypothetical protein
MTRQQSVVFSREPHATRALAQLEYSWIPTGFRHRVTLDLDADIKIETNSNQKPDEIFEVQVYHLFDGDFQVIKEGESFQLPFGRSYIAPLSYVTVEVSRKRRVAVFTAHFVDGTSWTASKGATA